MYLSKITVTLRPSILDPQGKAVEHAIASLNVGSVKDVRIGKYIEMKVNATDEESARKTTDEVCRKLLANPVMEDYRFEIVRL
ncbi:MAG TPA: phosphoribosylformylglycinamidine synthase subunit PurS [Bacteroidota bacterium]|nr:phosphoribosylformylglycinamidine synthase subunit PurS [Bacteroidota bacterium]